RGIIPWVPPSSWSAENDAPGVVEVLPSTTMAGIDLGMDLRGLAEGTATVTLRAGELVVGPLTVEVVRGSPLLELHEVRAVAEPRADSPTGSCHRARVWGRFGDDTTLYEDFVVAEPVSWSVEGTALAIEEDGNA